MLPRWLVNAVHDIRASSKQYLDAMCIVGLRAMNYHATDVDVKFYRLLLLLLLTYRDVQLQPFTGQSNAMCPRILWYRELWRYHCVFSLGNWIDLDETCTVMHSVVHTQAPSYIFDIFTPVTRLPGRANLRSAHQGHYDVPRVATGLGQRSFAVAGPKAWNSLPLGLEMYCCGLYP